MSNTLPMNFLGLDETCSRYDRARYAVWPVGYDATVSYRTGSREGPAAIILASRQVELFDPNLGREIHQPGVATLDPFDPDVSSPDASVNAIYRRAKKVLADGKFLISLGGEHSITSGIVRAHAAKHKKLSVLHIDAHLDMRDSYQNSKFSHACVIRRVHDLGIPTVSVGIRSVAIDEYRYLKRHRHPVYAAEQVHRDPQGTITNILADENLTENVYVTIDLDGFDPAYAPGVGTPVPGGLSWFHVNDLLTGLAHAHRIVGADIVECLPIPGQVATEFLAAKLAARLIALTQIGKKDQA